MANASVEEILRNNYGLTRSGKAWLYKGECNLDLARTAFNEPGRIVAMMKQWNPGIGIVGVCLMVSNPTLMIVESLRDVSPRAWGVSLDGNQLGELCGGLMTAFGFTIQECGGCFLMRGK
jgi:hypothetical protein